MAAWATPSPWSIQIYNQQMSGLVLSGEESVGEGGGVHQGVHGGAGEHPEEFAEEDKEVVTADINLCRL